MSNSVKSIWNFTHKYFLNQILIFQDFALHFLLLNCLVDKCYINIHIYMCGCMYTYILLVSHYSEICSIYSIYLSYCLRIQWIASLKCIHIIYMCMIASLWYSIVRNPFKLFTSLASEFCLASPFSSLHFPVYIAH